MPQMVTPWQRLTARQIWKIFLKSAACVASLVESDGVVMRMSSSVIRTSTPRSANRCRFCCMVEGTCPMIRWDWNPTQSIGTPRDLKSRTRL